jgi:hypothetical protein
VGRRQQRGYGRKRILLVDPAVKERFLDAVQAGVPIRHAGLHAGIAERTVFKWLAEGEDAQEALDAGETLTEVEEAVRSFREDTLSARASVAVRNMTLLQEAAQGGQLIRERTLPGGIVEREYAPIEWRAADTLLKRSFPQEFAEARSLELTGAGGGPVKFESSHTVVELAARLSAELARTREDDLVLEAGEGDVVDGEVLDDTDAPD